MSPDYNNCLPSYNEIVNPEAASMEEGSGATGKSNVLVDNMDPVEFSKDYSDLLPSFEMHNSVFNRTLNEGAPDYQESVTETLISSNNQIDSLHSTDPSLHSGEFVLNNLHKLQKLNLPIEVKITLTKESLKLGMPYERESPLRQYYPGDTIYGFVTFENKSNVNIPFEMMLVSLECELGIVNPKTRNQVLKKIIVMYDLEASYNYLPIDTYCNTCGIHDPIDNTQMGFTSRLVKPGIIVKKYFRFRIPTFLLDDNCEEQFPEHLKVPPSFGLNPTSMKYAASAIQIDTNLGYGRLSNQGSPIQVNDFALPGEFCSYFINVQMIGKRLNAYKQFYTPNTTHVYDFIFLKNVEHHFRVGKSSQSNEYRLEYGSTRDQLDAIEKTAIEAIEVLTERHMLNSLNITSIEQQDEIIYSSSGKSKISNLNESDKYLEKRQLTKSYENTVSVNFKKDIFSKVNGELTISAKMKGCALMKSFLPKLMEYKPTSVLFNEEYMKLVSPVVTLELSFKCSDSSPKFPTTFSINPTMIAMGVQSVNNLPFILDDDYLLQDSETTKKEFKKFTVYSEKIGQMMKSENTGIPSSTNSLLRSMAYLRYTEIVVPRLFKFHNIEIQRNQWKFDIESKSYKAKIKIPLELDVKSILANPKALIPSFQTCKFARLYKIQLDVTSKRGKNFKSFFPVTVI